MTDTVPSYSASRSGEQHRKARRSPWRRWSGLVAGLLTAAIIATMIGCNGNQRGTQPSEGPETDTQASSIVETPHGGPSTLAFGAQDTVIDGVTVPASASDGTQIAFDVSVGEVVVSRSRAAMVSFRVECRTVDRVVRMQSDGKISTNLFLARGGTVSGQALTAKSDSDLTCNLLASAPYIEDIGGGRSTFPIQSNLTADSGNGTHILGLHWLDDATLFEPGESMNVLSRQIDVPARLDRMSMTVRLTSCTVVGGSSDSGENKCADSMTGRESSTARVWVEARWLNADDSIGSTTTLWDETLAVDYDTHHVPWNLRLGNMGHHVPTEAVAVVLVVRVESIAGTPFVVRAEGTDAIITVSG